LWHIVPEGFRKIRYYGFLAPGNRQEKVDLIQKLLDVIVEKSSWATKSISEWLDRYEAVLNHRCPMCKTGVIEYLFAPT
jgi:transposase